MHKLITADTICKEQWLRLIEESFYTSPFQTPQFFKVLKETSGTGVEVYALSNNDNIKILMVVSLMKEPGLKGFFSKRGIIFGGPVLSNDVQNEELAFFLQEVVKKLKGKVIYLETRNFFDYSTYRSSFIKTGWQYIPYLNLKINLKKIEKEQIQSFFKYNRRREIKQSISHGATYRLCKNENELKEIYKILKDLYLTRVKLPLPSLDFFIGLYREGIIKAFIVQHENKTIGGSFCPLLSGKEIYTFYYCGIRDYHNRIFPTHLAVLAAMEYAIDNNIPGMDFMGAGKPDVDYGVRKYKTEFGGSQVEHGRFIKILSPFMYKLGKAGLKVLKKKLLSF